MNDSICPKVNISPSILFGPGRLITWSFEQYRSIDRSKNRTIDRPHIFSSHFLFRLSHSRCRSRSQAAATHRRLHRSHGRDQGRSCWILFGRRKVLVKGKSVMLLQPPLLSRAKSNISLRPNATIPFLTNTPTKNWQKTHTFFDKKHNRIFTKKIARILTKKNW